MKILNNCLFIPILLVSVPVTANTTNTAENFTFEQVCTKSDITSSHEVSLGKVQRIYLHANAMLQTTSSTDELPTKALFQRELSKLSLPNDCVEYLVHHSNVEQDATHTIARVYFDFDKTNLTPASQQILTRITSLITSKNSVIKVEGHTDNVGADNYNFSLALKRASRTEGFLVQQGVDNSKLQTMALGESKPIADNSTHDGRKLNRRVELKIAQ